MLHVIVLAHSKSSDPIALNVVARTTQMTSDSLFGSGETAGVVIRHLTEYDQSKWQTKENLPNEGISLQLNTYFFVIKTTNPTHHSPHKKTY